MSAGQYNDGSGPDFGFRGLGSNPVSATYLLCAWGRPFTSPCASVLTLRGNYPSRSEFLSPAGVHLIW